MSKIFDRNANIWTEIRIQRIENIERRIYKSFLILIFVTNSKHTIQIIFFQIIIKHSSIDEKKKEWRCFTFFSYWILEYFVKSLKTYKTKTSKIGLKRIGTVKSPPTSNHGLRLWKLEAWWWRWWGKFF